MWGKLGYTTTSDKRAYQRPADSELDYVTPVWEQRHPAWVFIVFGLQYLVFLSFLYIVLLPNIKYNQILATLEEGSFGRNDVDCQGVDQVCTFGNNLESQPQQASVWSEIESVEEVFTWLYQVVAVAWQAGFFGNFNQAFSLELALVRRPTAPESDPYFRPLLQNTLDLKTSTKEEVYRRLFYRANEADANVRDILFELRNTEQWFGPTTESVTVLLKVFNGFIGPWVSLQYAFKQPAAGSIAAERDITAVTVLQTNNPEKWVHLIWTYICILTIFAETIREAYIIYNWITKRPLQQRTAAITWRDYVVYYLKRRSVICSIKLMKLIYAAFVFYQLLIYVIAGPASALEASQNKNQGVPESILPFHSMTPYTAVAAPCLILMTIHLLTRLQRVHPDLDVVTHTCVTFFTMFYGCVILFLLLWMGWSCANYIFLGKDYPQFLTLPRSIYATFRFFFGYSTQPFLAQDAVAQSVLWSLLLVVAILFCHVVVIPICISTIASSYAFRETKRLAESQNEATGAWIRRKCLKGCRRRCFCFTPDPVHMSQHDDKADPALAQLHLFRSSRDAAPRLSENALVTNKESKTVAGAKPLAVSTSTDVATYWERLVLAVYVLFLFLFITGVIFLLDIRYQHEHFALMEANVLEPVILERYQPPSPPYGIDAPPFMPDRNPVLDANVISARNFSSLVYMSSIKTWIRDVLILRLLNNDFYLARHAVPLSNPLSVLFLTSAFYDNGDPFTKSFWPKRTGSSPTISSALSVTADTWQQQRQIETKQPKQSDTTQNYVRLYAGEGDPPEFYILSLFLGNSEQAMQDVDAIFEKNNILNGAIRHIQVQWGEYNGDARTFALHSIDAYVSITGKVDTYFDTTVFRETQETDTYIDATQTVVNFFPYPSFELLVGAALLLLLYCSIVLWLMIQRRWKASRLKTVLDIILLIIAFFLLVSMSDVMTPPFQPLWTEHEVPDADGVPRPEMHEVPGPGVLFPSPINEKFVSSIYLPSQQRAQRIVAQLLVLANYKFLVHRFAVLGIIVGLLRLPHFSSAFPDTIISNVPGLLYNVRWKLYIVILILAIITVAQAMLGFLLVGHVVPSYSTLKDSWITGWLLSTAKWNLRYVDHRSPRPLPLALALIAVSVLLWVFVFHSLILAVLLYGLRRSKLRHRALLRLSMQENWNLVPREKLTFRCNQKVLLSWRAIVKALQLKRRQLDTDGEFARGIDHFFLEFRTSPVFIRAPGTIEEYIKRSILAHNLTRVQQYISDIILLRCKQYLLTLDSANVKEATMNLKQTFQGKSKYIETLTKKLDTLKKQLLVIQDNIAFEQTDFRPDVTQVTHSPREDGEQLIDEGDRRRALEQLEAHRALVRAKKKHVEQERRKKKAATQEEQQRLLEHRHATEEGTSTPLRFPSLPTTAYQYIDPGQQRHSASKHAEHKPAVRFEDQMSRSQQRSDSWDFSRLAQMKDTSKKNAELLHPETSMHSKPSALSSSSQPTKRKKKRKPEGKPAPHRPETDVFGFTVD